MFISVYIYHDHDHDYDLARKVRERQNLITNDT